MCAKVKSYKATGQTLEQPEAEACQREQEPALHVAGLEKESTTPKCRLRQMSRGATPLTGQKRRKHADDDETVIAVIFVILGHPPPHYYQPWSSKFDDDKIF